jgi:hypothetical protein
MVTEAKPQSRVLGGAGPRKKPATKVIFGGPRRQKAPEKSQRATKAKPRTIQSIDAARIKRTAKAQQPRVLGQKIDTAAALSRKAEAAKKRGDLGAYRDLRQQREQAIIADREKAKETSRASISTAFKLGVGTLKPREVPPEARRIEARSNELRKQINEAQQQANSALHKRLVQEKTRVDQNLRNVTSARERALIIPEAKKLAVGLTPFAWVKDAKNLSAEEISAYTAIDTLALIPIVGVAARGAKAVMTAPKVKKIGNQIFDQGAKANPNLRYLYDEKANFFIKNADDIANLSNMSRGLPPNAPKRVKVLERDPVQDKKVQDVLDLINNDNKRKRIEQIGKKAGPSKVDKQELQKILDSVNDAARKERIAKTKLANEQKALQKIIKQELRKADRKSVSKQRQKAARQEAQQKADIASMKRAKLGLQKRKARQLRQKERAKEDAAKAKRDQQAKDAARIIAAAQEAKQSAKVTTAKLGAEAARRRARASTTETTAAADEKTAIGTQPNDPRANRAKTTEKKENGKTTEKTDDDKRKKTDDDKRKKTDDDTGKKTDDDKRKKTDDDTGKKKDDDTGKKKDDDTGKKKDDDTTAITGSDPSFITSEEFAIPPRFDTKKDIPEKPILDPPPKTETTTDRTLETTTDRTPEYFRERMKGGKYFRTRTIKGKRKARTKFVLPKPDKNIPDDYYPRRVTFLDGFTRWFVDLKTGKNKAIRSQKTGKPRETFKVLLATPRKPEPRKIPLGVVSMIVGQERVSFRRRSAPRSRLFRTRS